MFHKFTHLFFNVHIQRICERSLNYLYLDVLANWGTKFARFSLVNEINFRHQNNSTSRMRVIKFLFFFLSYQKIFIGTDLGRVAPHMFYQACKVSGKNSTPCVEKKLDGTIVIEIELKPDNEMTATCDCVGILKVSFSFFPSTFSLCSVYNLNLVLPGTECRCWTQISRSIGLTK